ncbi:MAG: hypothetical protein MRY32_00460 [Rickettsiales bacterium]|nr:hypothetical protein [Rickettsiales bacterium]
MVSSKTHDWDVAVSDIISNKHKLCDSIARKVVTQLQNDPHYKGVFDEL